MFFLPLANWHRYISCVIKYGSLKKYINFARAYLYYLKSASNIPTMPSFLKVEISRYCKVNCKYCYVKKGKSFYPFFLYKQLIDRFRDYCFSVSLYDIGEPLENEDVIEYIKYAHMNKMGTVISTSLSIRKTDEFWKELVLSDLDYLVVSIDGISGEVYNNYRTNGDLNLVMTNLRNILHYKAMYNMNIFIEWQMIDFPWNKGEQEAAKKMARDMGCDVFRLIPEAVLPRQKYTKENIIRKRNCLLPYILFFVTAYNEVRPCYKTYTNEDMNIGNLNHNTFDEIWNGEEITKIRDKRKIKDIIGCRTCRE